MGRYADEPAPLRAVDGPAPFDDGLTPSERNRVILTALTDDPTPAREWHANRERWALEVAAWAAANELLTVAELALLQRRGDTAAVAIANDVLRRHTNSRRSA